MLTLTAPAIAAIRSLTDQPGVPEKSGLRIAHQDTAGSLELRIAAEPEADDEVVEADGVRVFLHSEVASLLSNRTLSARVDEEGPIFRIDELPE